MCEKSGFWRWLPPITIRIVRSLPRELVWVIRAVSGGMVRDLRPSRVMAAIRDPFCEFIIGMMALFTFPMVLALTPDLNLITKIFLVLLSIPSFLLMMHGTYRRWVDC